jgi:hypothetical protein
MAATDVSICSNALLLLGDSPISSFEEGTDRSKLAANLYPTARNAILRSHPWNCCIKRVALAPDVAAPVFDYTYQFTLPSDFIKALQVGELGVETERFKIEGRKLLANDNPLLLRYVYRNDNPATWDDALVDAVTLEMAARMAYPITSSSSLADSKRKDAIAALRLAKSVDGQDDSPDELGDERLLAARLGSRTV